MCVWVLERLVGLDRPSVGRRSTGDDQVGRRSEARRAARDVGAQQRRRRAGRQDRIGQLRRRLPRPTAAHRPRRRRQDVPPHPARRAEEKVPAGARSPIEFPFQTPFLLDFHKCQGLLPDFSRIFRCSVGFSPNATELFKQTHSFTVDTESPSGDVRKQPPN